MADSSQPSPLEHEQLEGSARSDVEDAGRPRPDQVFRTATVRERPDTHADKQRRRKAIASSRTMTVLGGKAAARRAVAATAPGIKPLVARESASGEAETIVEAFARLDDTYRNMLLSAAGRDADPATKRAIQQAAATIALWWDVMPKEIRSNIDFKVDAWREQQHTRHAPEKHAAIDREAAERRVRMLLPHLRSHRSGTRSVAVALRLPA